MGEYSEILEGLSVGQQPNEILIYTEKLNNFSHFVFWINLWGANFCHS
jgi:hypothetical protein